MDASVFYYTPLALLFLAIFISLLVFSVYFLRLLIKALKKYITSGEVRKEQAKVCHSLGEALRQHRIDRKMTQEFVAERLGVSRQAVSKWESGISDPSTSNLLALAKLYGVPAEVLISSAQE